jgi:hypothetical protein
VGAQPGIGLGMDCLELVVLEGACFADGPELVGRDRDLAAFEQIAGKGDERVHGLAAAQRCQRATITRPA